MTTVREHHLGSATSAQFGAFLPIWPETRPKVVRGRVMQKA